MRSTTVYLVTLAITVVFLCMLANPFFLTDTFGNDSNGQTVDVRAGSVFKVILPENPTTGYSWDMNTSEGIVKLSDQYIPDDSSGMRVGSGGSHIWEFKAAEAGEQWVQGVYRRPWEGMKSDDKRYSLVVNVDSSKKMFNFASLQQTPTIESGRMSRLLRMPFSFLPPGAILSS